MIEFHRALPAQTTAGELASRLAGTRVAGNPDRPIRAIGASSGRAPDLLAFCDRSERIASCRASVVVVPASDAPPANDQTFIVADDVRAAFIDAVSLLLPGAARPFDPPPGMHPGARIDAGAQVSPLACIGDRVSIGPGACIGWVGLAYHDRGDGRRDFFPHLAGVRIGDRVDIGAQACVCRGMLTHTVLGDDVKVGSLVYVSHGVTIATRAWLSAGTAIAGHSSIGEACVLGIGSIVIDNVDLDDATLVGGGSVVTRSAAAGTRLHGVPAVPVAGMRRFGPTPR